MSIYSHFNVHKDGLTDRMILMTTESQDLGLTSHPKDGACWQYIVPVTIPGC